MVKTIKIVIPDDSINITLFKKYKYVVVNAVYYTGKLKSMYVFKYDADIKKTVKTMCHSLPVDTKFVDSGSYTWIPAKDKNEHLNYINCNIMCMINNISYYDNKITVECYK